jgi:hypothetical protein
MEIRIPRAAGLLLCDLRPDGSVLVDRPDHALEDSLQIEYCQFTSKEVRLGLFPSPRHTSDPKWERRTKFWNLCNQRWRLFMLFWTSVNLGEVALV